MQITAQELAKLLDGEVVGDPTVQVSAPSRIEEGKEGTISFLAEAKYESYAYESRASILLVNKDFEPKESIAPTMIQVDNVRASMQTLMEAFAPKSEANGEIHASAIVEEGATIGQNVTIGEHVIVRSGSTIGDNCILGALSYVGHDVQLGKSVRLHEGVKILDNCIVGDHCILHQNAVIGSEGFGFSQNDKREFTKIPQIGNVILEDHVEIGVNSCVDRAMMGSTILRKGVKIDNLVQVGHNCEIGEHSGLAAQVGVAGSTRLGKHILVGGQVGFAGHLTVADGAMFAAQSGVNSSVKQENAQLCGAPAIDNRQFWRAASVFKNLPDLARTVRRLEKELETLKNQTS